MFKNIAKFFAKNGGYFDQFKDLKASRLEEKELNDQLKTLRLDDWKFDKTGNKISKRLSTKDFKNSNDFVQALNGVAQRIGVKPDVSPGYDYLDINLTSNDLKGVSQKDLGLASSINRLERSYRDYLQKGSNNSDFKLELRPEEEEEIFNSVSGRAENSEKGYGQDTGFTNAGQGSSGKGASTQGSSGQGSSGQGSSGQGSSGQGSSGQGSSGKGSSGQGSSGQGSSGQGSSGQGSSGQGSSGQGSSGQGSSGKGSSGQGSSGQGSSGQGSHQTTGGQGQSGNSQGQSGQTQTSAGGYGRSEGSVSGKASSSGSSGSQGQSGQSGNSSSYERSQGSTDQNQGTSGQSQGSSAQSRSQANTQGQYGQGQGSSQGQVGASSQNSSGVTGSNSQNVGSSSGQGNQSCSSTDKNHKHDNTCADGYNFNKDTKASKVGQDTLGKDSDWSKNQDTSKTNQDSPSKFGQDSENKPQQSFGRHGSQDATLKDEDLNKSGRGSFDTIGQSAKPTSAYDRSSQDANTKAGNSYGADTVLGTSKNSPIKDSNESSSHRAGRDDSQKDHQGSGAQGSTTARADTQANKDYKESLKERTSNQGSSNHNDGDTSKQNNQYRDSTANFYTNSANNNDQVNNTSYKANQDAAHRGGQDPSLGKESNYGKGSTTNQGVEDKNKVGTQYPSSDKDNKPKDSEKDKAQQNREETSKTNARQNQVQDDTNRKRDNNDSNEFPNPRDRQDGVRASTLKDDKSTKDHKDSENTKSSATQKKEQDRFNGNQDKARQTNEKSYK